MNDNKKEGMPDVAEAIAKKRPAVLIFIALVLVAFSSMYVMRKKSDKPVKVSDETYSVQQQPVISAKPLVETAKAAPAPVETKMTKEEMQQQVALIMEKQKALQQRLSAPLMVVNGGQSKTVPTEAGSTKETSTDANTQFMSQVSSQDTARAMATIMAPLSAMIAEGSFIHAILEPATDSDLPGHLRAIVSDPVYSEDGSQILIPSGSRLLGQYKSGMLQGQSRVFIAWTRVMTPAGISVQLGSAGVDALGVAGIGADEIDRHFWQRFGTASLMSLLSAGAANTGVSNDDQNNSASIYRSAIANSFAQTSNQSLQQNNNIAPTLKTWQGKRIMVFVARDLDFEHAMQLSKPKLKLF